MRNLFLYLSVFIMFSCTNTIDNNDIVVTRVSNPILPGYFADPSIVEHDGTYYIYATVDPWGKEFLSCWSSEDFINWTFHKLNWPTKDECNTPLSNENKVWAPSVVKRNGNYYMYVSVGSEIWCGVASNPLGLWKNALIDKPLVSYDESEYYHVIDAEVFVDTDNRAYLYWGSGWNWINGHCFVAELNDDMCSFKSEKVEVTPENYFEAPFMIKHKSKYFLTYSDGKTIDDTYKVRYAIGDSPFGPFKEACNSPILSTDMSKKVYGPGHHSVYNINGQSYIFYHKHRLPYVSGTAYRQLCMDTIKIENDSICKVISSGAIDLKIGKGNGGSILNFTVETSSYENSNFRQENMTDESNQTMWKANKNDGKPWMMLSLPFISDDFCISLLFEYPWKKYEFDCEISTDGVDWKPFYKNVGDEIIGSPFKMKVDKKAKHIRFTFNDNPGIWETRIVKQ